MKRLLLSLLSVGSALFSEAQIGYQVALLNSATGEPRANVTVSVDVTLKGANGSTIFSQTQRATSNDLGLLSLSIGNETMFDDVDWNTVLPLSVSVKADGVLVAESQVLTVPVAEYAKKAGYQVTMEDYEGTWYGTNLYYNYEFYWYITDTTATFKSHYEGGAAETRTYTVKCIYNGNLYLNDSQGYSEILTFTPVDHKLYVCGFEHYFSKVQ